MMPVQRFVRVNARKIRDIAARQLTRMNEVFHGFVPVKLNQLETYQSERYGQLARERIRGETRAAMGSETLPSLVDIMSATGFFGILYFAGSSVQDGDKTLGEFMTFFTAVGMMFEPLRRLGAVSGAWQVASAGIEWIKQIMDTYPTLQDPGSPAAVPVGIPDIRLEDVHLNCGEVAVLQGLSFTAEAVAVTALVGASGAGKSTVFQVLSRLVDPGSGHVQIGGVSVNALRLEGLRSLISTVSQDALLFDETLRENVVLNQRLPDNRKRSMQHMSQTFWSVWRMEQTHRSCRVGRHCPEDRVSVWPSRVPC